MRKIFKGFLSFSPLTTSEAVTHMIDVLKDYGVNYSPIYNEVRELTKQETFLDKKISFFINRTVNEIEAESEVIIKRNKLLSSALKENTELSFEMLKRLCYAAEYKDEQSALHLVRISYYSTKLYAQIESDQAKVNNLTYASLLHDIGKVGIPDAILLGSFRKYCGYYQPIHVIIFIGQPVGGMAMDTLDIFNEFAKLSPFHK
ncbi:MAG TPA: hypothetical protein VFC84_09050, partial [Desulfosporosinus sp.]|nr:hypothetical protein [Desulfosporosinus sp.]